MLEYLWSCVDERDVLLPPGRIVDVESRRTLLAHILPRFSVRCQCLELIRRFKHFFKIAFMWSEKRFFWPPGARWPCCSSECRMRRGSRLDCIRMTWPIHLSWRCMTKCSMLWVSMPLTLTVIYKERIEFLHLLSSIYSLTILRWFPTFFDVILWSVIISKANLPKFNSIRLNLTVYS